MPLGPWRGTATDGGRGLGRATGRPERTGRAMGWTHGVTGTEALGAGGAAGLGAGCDGAAGAGLEPDDDRPPPPPWALPPRAATGHAVAARTTIVTTAHFQTKRRGFTALLRACPSIRP